MKAVAFEKFGSADELIVEDRAVPDPAPNEVLIKTCAISVNPVDVKTRQGGALASMLMESLPLILGWDVSGVVVACGDSVKRFQSGDEVFGMIRFPNVPNGYAEYVVAPEGHLVAKPNAVTHQEAAATTLAALTAWQAFTHFGKLKQNDRVLIHAASGGVGHFAVQIAKYLGAYVIGTSSAKNREFVLACGADEHLDYRDADFTKQLKGIDFSLETQGGEHFERTVKVMREGGTIINLPSGLGESARTAAESKSLTVNYFMSVFPSSQHMQQIASLLSSGDIKPHISKTFRLDAAGDAHREIETGRTRGKIILETAACC
ncbi:NADP-dependent oxidoreductase [Vreelandella utahensis]|uniref:NADP-dependent oxidoreductase n=1 Tax=Vreelandella halophila TaxID=86177 RepID=UPI000984A656|nr:NADP-dependent oxidoreductase [Halomonas utahensis]